MTSHSANTTQPKVSALGFEPHDHHVCQKDGMATAEDRCSREGLRFTPVRRKTLEILLQDHRALGAYDILERLNEAGFGSQPPVAYRALDFLVAHGFAHKIERLNGFVACSESGAAHSPAFMICRACDAVTETQATPARGALGDAAKAAGFVIERTVVEAEGLCPNCADEDAP